MADVFISYRNLDDRRRLVARFATILRAYDISVWWDHGLEAGASYADQIMRELAEAKLVIPFWCEESVASPWVLKEAEVGRSKLLPVRIQRVAPPDAFEAIHSTHLENWNGSILDPVLDGFVRDICDRLGKSSRIAADSKTELSRLPAIKPLRPPRVAKPAVAKPNQGRPGGVSPVAMFTALGVLLVAGAGVAWSVDPLGWRTASAGPADGAPLAADPVPTSSLESSASLVTKTVTAPQSNAAPPPARPEIAPSAATTAAPAAQPSEAAKAWTALDSKSPADVRTFLARYASAPEAGNARARLVALEATAWATASKANTIEAYDRFLRNFPASANPAPARAKDAVAARAQLAAPVATPPALPEVAPSASTPPAPAAPEFQDLAALVAQYKDSTRFAKPTAGRYVGEMLRENYPPASQRAKEEGSVAVSMCVDAQGRVSQVKLVTSSGFTRLDEASLKGLPRTRVNPARLDGAGVAVCGYSFNLQWKLPEYAPAPPPQ